MSDETRRTLDMLAQGKITVDEAQQLLCALKNEPAPAAGSGDAPSGDSAAPKRHLRISVHEAGRDGRKDTDVNIRVPLAFIRAGMRLGMLIPGLNEKVSARLREKGIDIDAKMDAQAIEDMIKDLGQINVDVDEGHKQVRITCE